MNIPYPSSDRAHSSSTIDVYFWWCKDCIKSEHITTAVHLLILLEWDWLINITSLLFLWAIWKRINLLEGKDATLHREVAIHEETVEVLQDKIQNMWQPMQQQRGQAGNITSHRFSKRRTARKNITDRSFSQKINYFQTYFSPTILLFSNPANA